MRSTRPPRYQSRITRCAHASRDSAAAARMQRTLRGTPRPRPRCGRGSRPMRFRRRANRRSVKGGYAGWEARPRGEPARGGPGTRHRRLRAEGARPPRIRSGIGNDAGPRCDVTKAEVPPIRSRPIRRRPGPAGSVPVGICVRRGRVPSRQGQDPACPFGRTRGRGGSPPGVRVVEDFDGKRAVASGSICSGRIVDAPVAVPIGERPARRTSGLCARRRRSRERRHGDDARHAAVIRMRREASGTVRHGRKRREGLRPTWVGNQRRVNDV